MKKIIFTLIMMFTFMSINTVNANNYKEIFKETNTKINFGFHFGGIGCSDDLGLQQILMSTTIYGVYADFGGWPSSHGSDVRVDTWDDDKALTFHVGYQVPITKWLRVIPMVGYAYDATGTTDGYNWHTDSNGIHNKFNVDDQIKDFDYGGAVVFNMKHFNIQVTATRYSWYAGIGIEF